MSDSSDASKSLRDRLGTGTEDRIGRALGELLDNPLLTGALGRAFDAREKAAQAQEMALGALNIPSAADIERLTRRLRSVSQRLEGIEDGVARLDRTLASSAVEGRLAAIEAKLALLVEIAERTQPAQESKRKEQRRKASEGAAPGRKAPERKGGGRRTTS